MASTELLAQRADVLATVVLTRHPDVIISRAAAGGSPELLVEIAPGGKRIGRMFGVELLGVVAAQKVGRAGSGGRVSLSPALRAALKKSQKMSQDLPYPLLFIIFEMESDRGFYGWLREPGAREGFPLLTSPSIDHATEWSAETHRVIVAAVADWYDARRIAPAKASLRRKAS